MEDTPHFDAEGANSDLELKKFFYNLDHNLKLVDYEESLEIAHTSDERLQDFLTPIGCSEKDLLSSNSEMEKADKPDKRLL